MGTWLGDTVNDYVCFGSPEAFEIAVRWSADREARKKLPKDHGWSTGHLRLTVGGKVITRHEFEGETRDAYAWYLSPVMEWLAAAWPWLLHEEHFLWPDRSGAPAALATQAALERYISAEDSVDQEKYTDIRKWWSRHALRASDSSAVYPDVYIRRIGDNAEVSWSGNQHPYSPHGLRLTLATGYASIPVADVAKPLWEFLQWGISTGVPVTSHDHMLMARLKERVSQLQQTPLSCLEISHVRENLHGLLDSLVLSTHWKSDRVPVPGVPVAEELDSAVLMFGGLDVQIGQRDAGLLIEFLASHRGQSSRHRIDELADDPEFNSGMRPYDEGYELALDARDALGIRQDHTYVDIKALLTLLDIDVIQQQLDTDTIRGVALAGEGFRPAILINRTSAYNSTDEGQRFTLAHELCHLLYDRTRARRLSHVSGPWASARVEKRANAFAAMFLAATPALRRMVASTDESPIRQISVDFGISYFALVEHLYNVDLIGDAERARLQQSKHQ